MGFRIHVATGHDPAMLAFAAVVVVYLGVVVLLSNRLKRYPAAWERAGAFSLFMNNTPRTGMQFLRFVFSACYRTLNDRPLTLMVWTVRILLVTSLALFIWSIVAVSAQQNLR